MGTGDFIKKPDRRFKLLVLIQGLWVITLLVLAIWWGTLLRQQSDEIGNLQAQLGVSESQIQSRLGRTEGMIKGESGFFVFLILITNGILLFFFARDTKRSRSLEAFFASITHELRTPLTSIRLQAEALQDIEDNPKHKPFLNRLLEDVGRLEGQVQQTLELARIEGGGTLRSEPLRLKSYIQNKIFPLYELGENRIQLDLQFEEAFVLADPSALTIIFRNIFDNALKYSKELPAKIQFSFEKQGDYLNLKVNHQNSQFSGEKKNLGHLFYRGSNSQGAGVGLYLIHTLMTKMKGSAEFHPGEENFTTLLIFKREKQDAIDG